MDSTTPITNDALSAAIAAVMSEYQRLEKADENKFGHYRFTSIDDFKDALRPIMAKHGLTLGITETNFDMSQEREAQTEKGVKKTIMFSVQLQFTLRHVSGESETPEQVSVCIPYVGAQSTGIARSYALKEWLKGKFLASSGDIDDADNERQSNYTLSRKEAKEVYVKLQASLREQPAKRGALLAWASDNRPEIASLPESWRETLRQEYQERLDTAPKETKSEPQKPPAAPNTETAEYPAGQAMFDDWTARLKDADRSSQEELFEAEIEPARERGEIPAQIYNSFLALIKDA